MTPKAPAAMATATDIPTTATRDSPGYLASILSPSFTSSQEKASWSNSRSPRASRAASLWCSKNPPKGGTTNIKEESKDERQSLADGGVDVGGSGGVSCGGAGSGGH